ncbi:NPC intracellular cholesterol transporter 2 homolog a-like [Belonocnema kinseyi]|uniref:NPC intracellular cholesterol transporter 2 homolog a-like n=1 Tax=Belonocnema kinseyi TaxID=2817044 RepID=UPI00143D6149|nr:NPC intracellular cholesterol transporter 2 homolog a-like [Belonocnema kinseyi]
MAYVIFAFILGFCLTFVQSTSFEECVGIPPPTELRIEGCISPPCDLIRGSNVTAEWDFVVTSRTEALKPKVKAYVLDSITVDYPLGQKDACETLTNAECPLDESEEVTYALHMPVLPSYPKIKLKIEFSLIGDDGNVQVCFKIAARVADKSRM